MRKKLTEEQKKRKGEYDKKFRIDNLDKIRERQKKWYVDNRDKKRNYDKKRYATDRDKQSEIRKNWHYANREKVIERLKKWVADNPDKMLENECVRSLTKGINVTRSQMRQEYKELIEVQKLIIKIKRLCKTSKN